MVTVCRMLRWKGFYGRDAAGPDWLADQHAANETPYSCLLTAQPWGPDDQPASIDSCGNDRVCCSMRGIGSSDGRKDA